MITKNIEPFAWVVLDEHGGVEYAAAWADACHEHINDAIMDDRLEAAKWVVHPAFTGPHVPQTADHTLREQLLEEVAKRAEAYVYMSANFIAFAEEIRRMK